MGQGGPELGQVRVDGGLAAHRDDLDRVGGLAREVVVESQISLLGRD